MTQPQNNPHPAGWGCFAVWLKNQARRQQHTPMNKPDQCLDLAVDGLSPEKIIETMKDPEFAVDQLPGLWQQIADCDEWPPDEQRTAWQTGVDWMFMCCETYPQHMKLFSAVIGLPGSAWSITGRVRVHGSDLLKQATPEQLLQALEHERQHPYSWWSPNGQIRFCATVEQLTGPVIEHLRCDMELIDWMSAPDVWPVSMGTRRRHIVEHVQQRLLGGDKAAWTVFLGIVDPETSIGEAAALAVAIAQQHRPGHSGHGRNMA